MWSSIPTYSTPSFLYCINMLLLSQSMNQYWHFIINWKVHFFPQTSHLTSFSVPVSYWLIMYSYTHPGSANFPYSPLFLMILTVFRNTGEVFCKMSPSWDLPNTFLMMIRMRFCILVSRIRDLRCSYHIKSAYYHLGWSLMMLTWPPCWGNVC